LDRRGVSILLIPVIAAFALLHPTTDRGSTAGLPQTHRLAQSAEHAILPEDSLEWHGGRDAVQNFFMLSKSEPGSHWPNAAQDPRTTATLKFLIATVPDPVDSGLPHSFDRFIAAIQAAVQTQSYFLSDFDLPWEDCLHEGKKGSNESTGGNLNFEIKEKKPGVSITTAPTDKCHEQRFTQVPGFLLFSNSRGDTSSDPAGDKSKPDLLLVYLIGESPTSGIHQRPLITSLNEIAGYCGWRKDAAQTASLATGPKSTNCSQKDLRILGPSFSGSAQSLDFALGFWLDSSNLDNLKVTKREGPVSGRA
jgi:hypothetical protein